MCRQLSCQQFGRRLLSEIPVFAEHFAAVTCDHLDLVPRAVTRCGKTFSHFEVIAKNSLARFGAGFGRTALIHLFLRRAGEDRAWHVAC